jgi:CSLREA domain-containing protein
MCRRFRFLPPFIAAVIVVAMPRFATAATFVVDSTADAVDTAPGDGVCAAAGGACTLRAAVQEANGPSGFGEGRVNTITLPAGTYLLTIPGQFQSAAAGDLDVIGQLEIDGAGAATTIVDGGGLDRVFGVGNTQDSLTLRGVTVRNGAAPDNLGGGIYSGGRITLVDSAVRDSNAAIGGGIYALTATLIRSEVTGNSSTSFCGGIRSYDATIVESIVSGNHTLGHGGGIAAGGELLLERSTVSGNTADGHGGALHFSGEEAIIDNTTVSGNSAGGDGGGIYRAGPEVPPDEPLEHVFLNNVTVTANHADSDGNGSGDGGGVGGNTLVPGFVARNTIVAGNTDDGGEAPDCAGDVGLQGHNLVQDATGCPLVAGPGDLIGISPALGPLANNGGSTMTHALLPGSAAIDAGDDAIPGTGGTACESRDQRGVVRPQPTRCDIGAFEVDANVCSAVLSGCKQAVAGGSRLRLTRTVGKPDKNRLLWKWKGAATSAAEFGDPLAGTDYILCVFDTTGGTPSAVVRAIVPGGTCALKPCWTTGGSALVYKNRIAPSSGINAMKLSPSVAIAAINAKGKGADLDLPQLPLNQAPRVLAQLQRTDGNGCWEASYSTSIKNVPGQFKATSD